MGTRGAIARPDNAHAGAFAGRYHHWDSYPSGLGATLFHIRRDTFGGDTAKMLDLLIDQHPAGWSTINGVDLTRQPGFHEDLLGHKLSCTICGESGAAHLCQTFGPDAHPYGKYPCGENFAYHLGHLHKADPTELADRQLDPQCYCHGDRAEDEWLVTQENASGSGVEWVYVIDGPVMHVLSSRHADGTKAIGVFGFGDPNAAWVGVARVNLDGEEPDWEKIESRGGED